MSKNSRNTSSKARQKPAKIHFDRTGKNMTSKAGLIPVVKFLEKLGFNKLFQNTVKHKRGN
ncbi:MAG: IS1380 family transposase, partial [Candidatus Polarisedimenticolaceae bacterium]|nr:IS1380 family transposase [Candidatus Polarisedimenticolaceae bacterium]